LHIDILAAGRTQGQDVTPNYQENFPTNPNVFYGWLRSPTDVRPASLVDFPGWSQNSDFDFETVAKATDTQAIYGALHWGFQVRAGATTNEYAFALNAESAAFNEALDRFRGFYTHEPIVFYFDTDQSTPLPGEDAKLAGVLSYLSSFSDVVVDIDGYADERGTLGHNKRLSQDRANFIQALAISFGIDPGRIQRVEGHGETTTFSAGSASAAPGSLRANRRVVMSFHRTASTPVTAPPVLGGP
jgi:outer membrane protein OmpA-like peptidoglycan-associated protein